MAHDWSLATTLLGDPGSPPPATPEVQPAGSIGLHTGPDLDAQASHDRLQLCIVLEGTASYECAGESVAVVARSIVWLFPDDPHVPSRASPDYQAWVVTLDAELVAHTCSGPSYEPLRKRQASSPLHRHLSKIHSKRLTVQCEALSAPDLDVTHFNAGLAYLLLSAWAEYQKAAASRDAASLHPAVEKAARILRAEPATGSLDELAKTCGASASWLSRLFRQQMSVSLVDFRNHCRIERFFQLYRDGRHRNIADAAFEAGFGSYAQFHRVFRKKLGYGPAELRRRVHDEAASAPPPYAC